MTLCNHHDKKLRRLDTHLLLAVALSLFCCKVAQSVTITVPGDQPTIQSGIDAASTNDTVLVSPGTYFENLRLKGKRIVLTSHFAIAGDTGYISATVIDGSSPPVADSASVIRVVDREDARTVIQGFTIRNGSGTKWQDEHSPGKYREGGGIICAFSSPTIRYNKILYNTVVGGVGLAGAGGGGIRVGDANPRILNNLIRHNNGVDYGGAIVVNYSDALIRNNVIDSNIGGAGFGGGGLWLNQCDSNPTIENNTLVANASTGDGGGFTSLGGRALLRNNIFWNNSSLGVAPQIRSAGASLTIDYNDIEGGGFAGAGNINVDPLFVDYNLYIPSAVSPVIDAGHPVATYNDRENPSSPGSPLFPAQGALRNDMGAYGGPMSWPLDLDNDNVSDIIDNCPDKINPDQLDSDGDQLGDACDNCPAIYNPDQTDANHDNVADICGHVSATVNVHAGNIPLATQFSGSSDLAVSQWNWDFGDGNLSSSQSPSHAYATAGVYKVTLSVTTTSGVWTAQYDRWISATADTITADSVVTLGDEQVRVDIYARNTIPILQLQIPFAWGGPLGMNFDSGSTAGLRTDFFQTKQLSAYDPFGMTASYLLIAGGGINPPLLTPGAGPVLSLYFTVPPGAPGATNPIPLQADAAVPRFATSLYNWIPKANNGVVLMPFLCGDADGQRSIDITDAVFLIDYIFSGGPAPYRNDEADANGNNSVGIDDVVYLIAYIFQGGPAPICGTTGT